MLFIRDTNRIWNEFRHAPGHRLSFAGEKRLQALEVVNERAGISVSRKRDSENEKIV